jgi:transposase-like protein
MKKAKKVKLQAEDRSRMVRLYEEINARYAEMAQITGRALNVRIPQILP